MVDFTYWFQGVTGTCKLISNPNAFERMWVLGDTIVTSIHYPGELFEQLLGDLHLEECLQHFANRLREEDAFEAIANLRAFSLTWKKKCCGLYSSFPFSFLAPQ